MKNNQRIGLFLFFLVCGLLVFIVFSHYFPIFKGKTDLIGRVVIAFTFLVTALTASRSKHFKKYWLILFSYFIALTAISIDKYLSLSKWILPALNVEGNSPAGWAIEKLESSLLGIVVILALNRLARQQMESLYIRRGNIQLGLIVGLVAFGVMIATAIPVTMVSFKGENLNWVRILSWTPWVLIFVLANASNEELLFRGIFIGKMEPFIGKLATNLVTTIPFVWMHAFVDYTSNNFIFRILELLPLSLAWCWLMQKTNSVWGSILFHAAADIPIVVGLFSNLP